MRRPVVALALLCAACAPIDGVPQQDPASKMLVSADELPDGYDVVPPTDTEPLRFNPAECQDFMGLPKHVEQRMAKIVALDLGSRITIRVGEVAPDEYDLADFEAFFARCPVVTAGDYRSGAALTAQPYDVPIDAPAYASRGDVIIEAPADQSYSYGLVVVARVDDVVITAQLLQTASTDLPDPPPDLDLIPRRQEFIDLVNRQVERAAQ